jgi:putative nucleotidyltransferase with HDIG domain
VTRDRFPPERDKPADRILAGLKERLMGLEWFRPLMATFFVVGTTYLTLPPPAPRISMLESGDVSNRDYRADYDVLVRDGEATRLKMEEAAARVRPVYDMDVEAPARTKNLLAEFFRESRQIIQEGGRSEISGAGPEPDKAARQRAREGEKQKRDKIEQVFRRLFGADLPVDVVSYLVKDRFSPESEKTAIDALEGVLERGVISNKSLLRQAEEGIVVRYLSDGGERVVENLAAIIDPPEAEKIMALHVADRISDEDLRHSVTVMSSMILQPNLTLNKSETEARMAAARESPSPVFLQVKAGEIIAREGERITPDQLMKISQIWVEEEPARRMSLVSGIFLLNIMVAFLLWLFMSRYQTELLEKKLDIALLTTVFFLALVLSRLTLVLAKPITSSYPTLSVESLLFGFPISFAPWLAAMLVSTRSAFMMAVVTAFYASVLFGGDVAYLGPFMATGFLAAHLGGICHQRTVFFKIGLFIGLLNGALITAQNLVKPEFMSRGSLDAIFFGFSSGPAAALIVSGALPIFEHLFGKTTDIKLLELSNPNSPLLKKLVVEAPGSYHHSILVGNLAEAAAEGVGANPLLVRISSYYHDIGKIKKPEYFIENSLDRSTRHDSLAPSMSSLVILSHVKEGLELAREYKLPGVIMDAIRQHHGTSLITYFFKKAREQQDTAVQAIEESDFRYPGPKPQNRENAIIMLADQVEAACRALPDPSHSKIKGVVMRIINNIFVDGQLNECNLTLMDLEIIQEQFTRVLVGTYHQRLDYPVVVDGKLLEEESAEHKKPPKERKARPAVN